MESVVALCNILRRMMVHQSGAKPSLATLNKAFAAYQKERRPRMQHIMEFSSMVTNAQAWRTPLYRFVATWILPLQSDRAVADQLGEIIMEAPKLDFVDVKNFTSGRLLWNNEGIQKEKQKNRPGKTGDRFQDWLALLAHMMSAVLAIGVFVFAGYYFGILAIA